MWKQNLTIHYNKSILYPKSNGNLHFTSIEVLNWLSWSYIISMWTYNDALLSGQILLFASSNIATKYLDWTNSGGKDLYNS